MTFLDRGRSPRPHRRRTACSPSLGAADGSLPLEPRLLLAAADPTPIPTLFIPSPSFTTGQHIVSATVFNWFDANGGQRSGPWRPVEGRQNWTGDVAFWERQLKDMMDANIDLLYVIEIPDHDPQRVNLFAAANDLRSQGYNVPKIAPFLDPVITWTLQPPSTSPPPPARTPGSRSIRSGSTSTTPSTPTPTPTTTSARSTASPSS